MVRNSYISDAVLPWTEGGATEAAANPLHLKIYAMVTGVSAATNIQALLNVGPKRQVAAALTSLFHSPLLRDR